MPMEEVPSRRKLAHISRVRAFFLNSVSSGINKSEAESGPFNLACCLSGILACCKWEPFWVLCMLTRQIYLSCYSTWSVYIILSTGPERSNSCCTQAFDNLYSSMNKKEMHRRHVQSSPQSQGPIVTKH